MAPHSSTLAWKIPWTEEPRAAVHGVTKSGTRKIDFTFTFHFHALEKEMAAHSSVLACRIPGTGEPSGLPSMGSHRVRHDWSDIAAASQLSQPRKALDRMWIHTFKSAHKENAWSRDFAEDLDQSAKEQRIPGHRRKSLFTVFMRPTGPQKLNLKRWSRWKGRSVQRF